VKPWYVTLQTHRRPNNVTKHPHVPKPDIYRYRYINIIDIDDVLLNLNGTIVVCVIVIARIKYIIDDCVHQA